MPWAPSGIQGPWFLSGSADCFPVIEPDLGTIGEEKVAAALQPKVIAVSGGSGSGKTTLVGRLRAAFGEKDLLILQLDHYYRDLAHLSAAERDQRNFDHPEAFDTELLLNHVSRLVAGQSIRRPTYDFATHTRTGVEVNLEPCPIVVLDGILALHWADIRKLLALAVYVDVDDDVRFIRRLRRDVTERGRTVESVINQYLGTVKVMHDTFVAPQKRVADIIVDWHEYNDRAVAMLAGMARTWVLRSTAKG